MQPLQACRARWLAILLLAAAAPALAVDTTGEIVVGDPAEKVRTALGEPRGSIRSGAYELLQYDRGRVELRDGVVATVDLVSAGEAALRKVAQAEEQRAARERQALQREQRRLEGLETRDRALANPDFLASSGDRQVEYWDSFRRRYPDVPVDVEYAAALAKQDTDRQQRETERRLAHMEERVAAAEDRARDAEEDAEDARRDARRRYVYYNSYPYYRYPSYPACPPGTNRGSYVATYPRTVYPYSHGYTVWGGPTYVQRAPNCSTVSTRSSGVRVNVNF